MTVLESPLIESFVQFLYKELKIAPKKVIIAPYEVDDGISGLCIDESDDEFTLLVKVENRTIVAIFNTIAHEMIHAKQHMHQNLGWLLDNCRHIPYNERWWEKEALRGSNALVENFAKQIKKGT